MIAVSPLLHPPAIAPHQRAHPRVPVLRRLPARALGVIRSVGGVLRPAEIPPLLGVSSLRLERLALQGWPLLSGSLFFRVRSCLQALTVRACVVVRAASLIRLRPIRPHLLKSTLCVTPTSSHGGLFRCGQKLPGNEQ